MKSVYVKGLAVMLTAIVCFTFAGQPTSEVAVKKEAAETQQQQQFDTLVIEARLIEIPGTFPPNDLYNYVYVMKYRVLDVVKGAYDDREILVGHYNPLIARDQIDDAMDPYVEGDVEAFEEGDKHTLSVITPIEDVWNEAVEDEYFDYTGDKYYALIADKLEK